jgi:glycosyltransferase involved in cell wall biosynthesis
MKYFYFAFESIFDPIFDSQVLTYVEKYNSFAGDDEKISLVLFGSTGDLFKHGYHKEIKEIKNRMKGFFNYSFKIPYFYKYPCMLGFSMLLNSLVVFSVLFFKKRLRKKERFVCHCRTEIGSYILLKLRENFYKDMKIICDCRGIGSKEILYKSGINNKEMLSGKIRKIENYAHANSDYLFCVTESFKKYILDQHGNKIKKIKVIPCCIDTEKFRYDKNTREKCRNEMGIDPESFVVLYAGSLSGWQLPDAMIDIFNIIKEYIKNSIFVIFTRDIETASEKIKTSGMHEGNYIIDAKPPSGMNKYLTIGDLGLLIREDNEVNRVAFPVKFAEYCRCGVPVLSSITSDVTNIIERYKLGYRLEDYRDLENIKKVINKIKVNIDTIKSDSYKKRISDSIEKIVNWESYLEFILYVYRSLAR